MYVRYVAAPAEHGGVQGAHAGSQQEPRQALGRARPVNPAPLIPSTCIGNSVCFWKSLSFIMSIFRLFRFFFTVTCYYYYINRSIKTTLLTESRTLNSSVNCCFKITLISNIDTHIYIKHLIVICGL